jgi:hypothetical protein
MQIMRANRGKYLAAVFTILRAFKLFLDEKKRTIGDTTDVITALFPGKMKNVASQREAELISRFAGETPKPQPPAHLTKEQQTYWRRICQDVVLQSRVDSVVADRARSRAPTGRRPWEYPFGDDGPSEPEPQPSN